MSSFDPFKLTLFILIPILNMLQKSDDKINLPKKKKKINRSVISSENFNLTDKTNNANWPII